MKKPNLLSALAIAAVAVASLSLPATASADSIKHQERTVVRGDHPRDGQLRPVHNAERRYSDSHHHGHTRWAQSRYQQGRGHHHGHQRRHMHRHEVRPVERHVYRYDYRPVERYQPHYDDGIRVQLSYDLHL